MIAATSDNNNIQDERSAEEEKPTEKKEKKDSMASKVRAKIEGQSLVHITFGGRQLVDKYCIWFLFTLLIFVLVFYQLVNELSNVG